MTWDSDAGFDLIWQNLDKVQFPGIFVIQIFGVSLGDSTGKYSPHIPNIDALFSDTHKLFLVYLYWVLNVWVSRHVAKEDIDIWYMRAIFSGWIT